MNKRKIIIGGAIVLLIILFVTIGVIKNNGSSGVFTGGKTFSVYVAQINKGDISSYVTSTGTTEAVEKADLYFETSLKVKKLLVSQNDAVKKGQKLVELDMHPLYSQLEKLKISRDTQLAAMSSKSSQQMIASARSSLDTAQIAYDEAKKNYDTSSQLYIAGAISKAEYEKAQNGLKQAKSALDSAKASYESAVVSNEVGNKTNDLNLKSIEISIDDLERQIKRIEESAISPMDGAVSGVNLIEGGYTGSMQPAFNIIGTGKIQVRAFVREYDIRNVKEGQKVSITGDAIDKDKPVTGKVASISPIARRNITSGGEEIVIDVLVDVDDTDILLRPGINVNCDIYTIEKKGILTAPMNITREDKDGNKTVLVVDKKTKVMREKAVKLGISSDMTMEVLEGLNEGDLVVLDPQPVHKDGSIARILNKDYK